MRMDNQGIQPGLPGLEAEAGVKPVAIPQCTIVYGARTPLAIMPDVDLCAVPERLLGNDVPQLVLRKIENWKGDAHPFIAGQVVAPWKGSIQKTSMALLESMGLLDGLDAKSRFQLEYSGGLQTCFDHGLRALESALRANGLSASLVNGRNHGYSVVVKPFGVIG